MIDVDAEYLCDLGECDHSPLRPPRDLMPETVFTEMWLALMAQETNLVNDEIGSNRMLRYVIGYIASPILQRHATVAATFIQWLGTNCGASFLREARGAEAATSHGMGYLAAWAQYNRRESWLSNGFRAIEHLLGTDEDRRNGVLVRKPDLSSDDYEIIERVVLWLSTDSGMKFIKQCEDEIAVRRAAENVADAMQRKDYKAAIRYLREVENLT